LTLCCRARTRALSGVKGLVDTTSIIRIMYLHAGGATF
jgi:hypothetical protein